MILLVSALRYLFVQFSRQFFFFQAFDDVPATQLQSGEDIQCEFCEKVKQPEGSPLYNLSR